MLVSCIAAQLPEFIRNRGKNEQKLGLAGRHRDGYPPERISLVRPWRSHRDRTNHFLQNSTDFATLNLPTYLRDFIFHYLFLNYF